MARLITEEMGCPITQARNVQVVAPVDIIDSYLQTAQDYPFREVPCSLKGATALVVREPVGVVAAALRGTCRWASPLQKIVPALLTGCSVVLKPAPETPLVAYFPRSAPPCPAARKRH